MRAAIDLRFLNQEKETALDELYAEYEEQWE
jgi:hypothetical protein